MRVTVIGLGKIGLPLAVQYAMKRQEVLGVDISPEVVDKVNSGIEPFPGEENLQEFLAQVVADGSLRASLSLVDCVATSDVVVVVVPLKVNSLQEPDFSAIDSATRGIAKGLRRGTLVIYETTLPIGTTRNRCGRMLEELTQLKMGTDFFLVFSPERVLTGRIFSDLRKYPKIVGGANEASVERGRDFYETVLDFDSRPDLEKPNGVWAVESLESAEFTKLAETTYRDVNIALANTFAIHADQLEIDIYEVIEAANSQHFSQVHSPGVAVGGHCIPIYPLFYLAGDEAAAIVRVSRDINNEMPSYVVSRIIEHAGDLRDKKVLILGASYREDVKELTLSGVFPLNELFIKHGANPEIYDPLFTDEELIRSGLAPMHSNPNQFDIAVVQTRDKKFCDLFLQNEFSNLRFIFDGRNLFRGKSPKTGVALISIGNKVKFGSPPPELMTRMRPQ
jgi:nucleotide sugar dehydrogenase